jgi:hypothetical protein
VGDTSNWEFAAAVAAVSIGLGGLLLFTLVAALGSWRTFERASSAATEAAKASIALQDLARQMAAREDAQVNRAAVRSDDIEDLRRQTDALIAQQARLRDVLRTLLASEPRGGDDASDDAPDKVRELEAALSRLDENLDRASAAVAGLAHRQGS